MAKTEETKREEIEAIIKQSFKFVSPHLYYINIKASTNEDGTYNIDITCDDCPITLSILDRLSAIFQTKKINISLEEGEHFDSGCTSSSNIISIIEAIF